MAGGNFYRISVGADVFTVLIGEDNSVLAGDGNVNSIDEVLALLEYKINNSGSGISAVDNAATDNILVTVAPGSLLQEKLPIQIWLFVIIQTQLNLHLSEMRSQQMQEQLLLINGTELLMWPEQFGRL